MPDRTSNRPPLLFLCHVLPYPPDGGVYIRSHHTLRQLAEHFDVTAICFYRRGQHPDTRAVETSLAALRAYATIEAHPIPQEWSRSRLFADHIRSLLTGRVYTYYQYHDRMVADRLRVLLTQQEFVLAHIDSLDLLCYVPTLRSLPIACTHHNIESSLLRRRADHERSPWRRAYIMLQAALTERAECTWTPQFALNVMVSEEDRRRLAVLAPSAQAMVATNGVDLEAFTPKPLTGSGEIVFIGGLNWFPNLDGLEFFVDQILPHLQAQGVEAPIRWIGHVTPELRAQYAESGVILEGYVDDIRPYMQRAACFVVPLRVGGGTRLKILDAWALGKAIVSTSIGAEGLRTQDGENILLRDTPEDFAAGIAAILRDPSLRERLEHVGRATAEAHYGWQSIGETLATAYAPLIAPRQARR